MLVYFGLTYRTTNNKGGENAKEWRIHCTNIYKLLKSCTYQKATGTVRCGDSLFRRLGLIALLGLFLVDSCDSFLQ